VERRDKVIPNQKENGPTTIQKKIKKEKMKPLKRLHSTSSSSPPMQDMQMTKVYTANRVRLIIRLPSSYFPLLLPLVVAVVAVVVVGLVQLDCRPTFYVV
jgi:hypothetical protein